MITKERASVLSLRAALLRQGLTLTDFARIHGFEYYTVVRTIRRHWQKKTAPRGKASTRILDLLNRYYHQKPSIPSNQKDEEYARAGSI